jgi:hypothetical protein
LRFELYDTDNLQVGSTITQTITIVDGLFTTQLDFGAGVFNGDGRLLKIGVLCPGDADYVTLGLQTLQAAPYALYAVQAGEVPWSGVTGVPTDTLQARVTGGCDVGSAVRAVNADGSVVCWPDAPLNRAALPAANLSLALDTANAVGVYTAITIGADGLPLVSYMDQTNNDLKVLHCGDPTCSGGNTITAVDSAGDYRGTTDIALGPDGLAVISYWDYGNNDLKVLHCGNLACTSGNTATTVDSAGETGYYPSITISGDGLPLVTYLDNNTADLKVLHCGNAACTSGNTITTVDSADQVGEFSAVTLGADGLPIISYWDRTNSDLKILHCGNALCDSGNQITTVDSAGSVGEWTAITIGADGLPVVSYRDITTQAQKVLHCGSPLCDSGNQITVVDGIGSTFQFSSITVGADGLPVLGYSDLANGNLKVLHCGNLACSSGNTTLAVDSVGVVGEFVALTLGVDGLPILSYWDRTNDDLKVLHCANAYCAPYFRRP